MVTLSFDAATGSAKANTIATPAIGPMSLRISGFLFPWVDRPRRPKVLAPTRSLGPTITRDLVLGYPLRRDAVRLGGVRRSAGGAATQRES